MNLFKSAIVTSLLVALSGCGGGNNNSGGAGNSSGNQSFVGVVNGFYLQSRTGFNQFGGVISTRTWEINYDLNRIESTTITFNSDIDLQSPVTSRTGREYFDDNGRLILSESPTGSVLAVTDYEFDDQGLISQVIRSGDLDIISDFEYDSAGRLTAKSETFPDYPAGSITYSYEYNEAGLLTRHERRDQDSTLDPATQLQQFPDRIATTTYTHNELGQVVLADIAYRTDTVEPSDIDTELIMFRYDENGNMIEQSTDFGGFLFGVEFAVRTEYEYARSERPVFNRWLRRFRFFPP